MKSHFLALAAALLWCGAALAQDPAATPDANDDPAVEAGDTAAPDAGAPANDAPRPARYRNRRRSRSSPAAGSARGASASRTARPKRCNAAPPTSSTRAGNELKQNIRCASASGKIEVKSLVTASKEGKLSGTWNELVYNLGGEMTGEVTERGLRIVVRAGDLTANMDVIVMNDRQIVEIQFFNSTLRGLTLILKKG